MAVERSDNLHLTWQQYFWEVWYCRNSDGNWTEPIKVSKAVGLEPSGLPAMCVSPNDEFHIAFIYFVDGIPQIFERRIHGETWSEIVQVTNDPGGAILPAVTVDASGSTHFAWMRIFPTNTEVNHRRGIPKISEPVGGIKPNETRDWAFFARGDLRAFIDPVDLNERPKQFKIAQPRGEFVKIEISATIQLLQRLLHTDQTVRQQAMNEFLAAPIQYAPRPFRHRFCHVRAWQRK